MEKTLIPPRKPLRGPAGLEGVLIASCTFTESVGKKEPRPPLFCGRIAVNGVQTGEFTGDCLFLAVPAGSVLVHDATPWQTVCREPSVLGRVYPGTPKGPAYTGPITPSMWAIIRKWWNP